MVRFDKLRFIKEVEPDTLDLLVPSMLLQPLVENSIRHGLASKVDGGTIKVRSRRQGTQLQILVEDDGVGIPESRLARMFEQVRARSQRQRTAQVLYGDSYRMWIDSRPGKAPPRGSKFRSKSVVP
jgi:two-component system LytT family sensor kinase